jgi:hypothetical protein
MIDDALRPPPPTDPDAAAYKDWLHLNVFDHATGAVGLFNASLHGAPTEPSARTIGAALLHLPGVGWVGNVAVRGFDETVIGATSIAIDRLAIAVDPSGERVLVSATYPDDRFGATLSARAGTRPLAVEERMPFGHGWISWYVVPRLTVSGSVVASGTVIDMARASGYHDHNWGRWHWGDDVGWEWAALVAEAPGPALILSRTTNRDHRRASQPVLVIEHASVRRRFAGVVAIAFDGNFDAPLRRLPGAMAALHQDHAKPLLPLRVHVRASDGIDSVEVTFTTRAAAQLIAADPSRRGYGFVHELVGSFSGRITLAGEIFDSHGLGVFEYVQ